jgi:hypothetical protein
MLLLALLVAVSAGPVAIPVAAHNVEAPADLPDASSADEIIVTALKIPREKLPTGVYWSYQSRLLSKIARENAQMFYRCALRSSAVKSIRMVVDGEPNNAKTRFAQGWIRETNRGCYPPTGLAGNTGPSEANTILDAGRSVLDRGVIVETVLKTYVPDAALTPTITSDPAVQSRFKQREGFRNRLRLPVDRDALILATCLVREQPVLATRLFHAEPGSLLERGLIQTIIVEGRGCIGDASRVTVDPSFMRVYIMDAFYRWVVAARGVESLIPATA